MHLLYACRIHETRGVMFYLAADTRPVVGISSSALYVSVNCAAATESAFRSLLAGLLTLHQIGQAADPVLRTLLGVMRCMLHAPSIERAALVLILILRACKL